jgi:translation initiation factor IF-3
MEVSIKDKGRRSRDDGQRINEKIKLQECRLVGDDGNAYGIVPMTEARRISEETGLDLVEISPNARPPVVKLIDYGKYKYELQKKANEAKKKQVVSALKEIQYRPNIEAHDLETKLKKAAQFLEHGDKLKLVMQFRGREMAYRDAGMEKFKAIIEKIIGFGAQVESVPKMMGNRIIAILAPDKKSIKK